MREIALFSGVHQPKHKHALIILVILRLSIPYIARVFAYGTPFGFNWDSILYSVIEFIAYGTLSYMNFLFIIAGYIDFKRRVLMQRACSSLLNPFKKDESVKYQIFPTIDLGCKKSFYTWF